MSCSGRCEEDYPSNLQFSLQYHSMTSDVQVEEFDAGSKYFVSFDVMYCCHLIDDFDISVALCTF